MRNMRSTSAISSANTTSAPTRPNSSAIDREDEVVVRFRQIAELLNSGAETKTEQVAAAERNQRLGQLIAAAVSNPPTDRET